MKLLFTSLIIMACLSACDSNAINNRHFTKESCEVLTQASDTYKNAIDVLMLNTFIKSYVQDLKAVQSKIATNQLFNKPVYMDDTCWWEISLYESQLTKIQLWRTFLISIDSPIKLKALDTEGNPLDLEKVLNHGK